MTAPVSVVLSPTAPVVIPACCEAQFRHVASSIWKCSNGFPLPGRTITLGPLGTVAQPVKSTSPASGTSTDRLFIAVEGP
jgi:hypothetical protein